jgi:hypothetical protein
MAEHGQLGVSDSCDTTLFSGVAELAQFLPLAPLAAFTPSKHNQVDDRFPGQDGRVRC